MVRGRRATELQWWLCRHRWIPRIAGPVHRPRHWNFVTLGATLVMGTQGVIAKLLAPPEFILIVALARVAGTALRRAELPALPTLLVIKVCFLLAFFVLAVTLGPFSDSDAPAALLTGFAGIAGMAIQNAVQRV